MENKKETKVYYLANMLIDDIFGEVWANCVFVDKGVLYNYNGLYMVSNLGRVKSFKQPNWKGFDKGHSERICTIWKDCAGYLVVHLNKDGKRKQIGLHRLVALIFIPNPENKEEVNHKFGIKSDCRATELEWFTPEENVKHAVMMGLVKSWNKGRRGDIGLTKHKRIVKFTLDGEFVELFKSAREVCRKTNLSERSLKTALKGEAVKGFLWKQLNPTEIEQIITSRRQAV